MSRNLKSEPIAGCFGKLPFQREFVRFDAVHPEIESLDEFFQAAIENARRKSSASFARDWTAAKPFGVLWHPTPGGGLVTGASRTSTDSAGRHFPFTIFTLTPGAESAATTLLDVQSQVDGTLAAIATDLSSTEDVRARLTDLVRQPSAFASQRPPASLSTLRLSDFPDLSGDRGLRVFRNLAFVASSGKDSHAARLAYGLRLPVCRGRELLSLAFWLELTAKSLRQFGTPVAAFWRAGNDAFCIICLGRAIPGILKSLLTPADADDDVFRLDSESETAAESELSRSIAEALSAPDTSLADILKLY